MEEIIINALVARMKVEEDFTIDLVPIPYRERVEGLLAENK